MTRLWKLPATWEWCTVGELGDVVSGGTPSTKVPEYWGGDIIWIAPSDLTGYGQKYIARGAKTLTDQGLAGSSAKLIAAGSVMFSSRAPIGYVAINSGPSATNQGFKSIVPHPGFFNEYIYYYLKAAKHIAEERASGTTFKELSGSAFSALPVPIAPSNEQRRIVAQIEALFDEIDRGVESLQAAKRMIGLYRQSLLKAAFEGRLTARWRTENPEKLESPAMLLAKLREERDVEHQADFDDWQRRVTEWRTGGEVGKPPKRPRQPGEMQAKYIPHLATPACHGTWASARLGELNVLVSDGPFGSNLMTRDYTDAGVRVVRLENIGYGEFLEEKRSFISQGKFETINKHSVVPGTIVVSSFVTGGVRACIVPESIPIAVNKADCLAVTVRGARTSRSFLAYFLQSRQAFVQLEGLVHGVGRPRINTTQLRELHVPVCTPAEQFEVVRILDGRLEAINTLQAEIDANLARAAALCQSILKKAFLGKLVPQYPDDEPAQALLARIRACRDADSTNKRRARQRASGNPAR